MTKSSAFHPSVPLDLMSRIVDLGPLLARHDVRRAAAMMAAAEVPFRVIVRVTSEPNLLRRRSRQPRRLASASPKKSAIESPP